MVLISPDDQFYGLCHINSSENQGNQAIFFYGKDQTLKLTPGDTIANTAKQHKHKTVPERQDGEMYCHFLVYRCKFLLVNNCVPLNVSANTQ